jgi:nitrate reductase NapE component
MGFFRNPERLKAFAWFCASVLAVTLALFLLPFVIPHKTGTLGYNSPGEFSSFMPVLLIACLGVVGFIVSIAFLWSSLRLDALLAGKGALAKWEYSEEEMARVKQQVRTGEEKVRNRLLLYFFLIMLIFGAICVAMNPTGAYFIAAWVIGLWLLVAAAALVLQKATLGTDSDLANKVILSPYGALFCGTFHLWQTFASSLSSVSLDGAQGQKTLLISYVVASEHGTYSVKIEIPVPKEKEGEAAKAIEEMKPPYLKKLNKLLQAGTKAQGAMKK